MKTPRIYYGSIAVFCIAALVIGIGRCCDNDAAGNW